MVFIIILSFLLSKTGYAQNQAVNKMVVPQKVGISLFKVHPILSLYKTLPRANYKAAAANIPLLHFNDEPVLKLTSVAGKAIVLFTELSSSDVLENTVNGLKVNLANTYDDLVPELFSDAPSLFKIKCIVRL